ncbi:amidase [Pigmentiphaga aceris]|uniref:Amidase n=1 Tax=Pigmentiphaga aceris TaxID=1940612 RepID=A0A5C0ASF9_9BURK|nr:amidase [Pigmentiphaga aceris]QEI04935.1 amidase [Pigmentiphaga aceris]
MLLAHDPASAFVPYPAAPVAQAAEGPLAGLTFAAKDLFDVAGYPTGGGSPHVLARSGIKTVTAPVVQTLLNAGARFVGKTYTDELAFSMNGINAHFGTPRNGAAPDRIPGGSSSGSASAVSNGLCDFALGTDTGGSVRAPANHCGLYGIRPTHGRISLENCLDLAPSLDTCGFFARDIDTFARVGEVLLGDDSTVLPAHPPLLMAQDAFGLLNPDALHAHAPLLGKLTALLGAPTSANLASTPFEDLYWTFRTVQGFEAWETDGALIEQYKLALGPGVRERFIWSSQVTRERYDAALAARAAFKQTLAALLDGKVLVLPTMPDIAPLLTDPDSALEDYRNMATKLLLSAGLAGFPQISIPGGQRNGVPLGLSLMGPAGSDRQLIEIARALS